MDTTKNTSENNDLKIVVPSKFKILLWLEDKGLVFFVMGVVFWIMYNFIIEDRKERNEQIKDQNKQIEQLRGVVDDCAQAKKDRLTEEVQSINIKVDKLLNKRNL